MSQTAEPEPPIAESETTSASQTPAAGKGGGLATGAAVATGAALLKSKGALGLLKALPFT